MAKESMIRPYARQAVATLGLLVRSARTARGWSQAHLGAVCSIDRRTVAAIETGKLEVGIGTAFNVASVLNINLFDADEAEMIRLQRQQGEMVSLLPRRVDAPRKEANDDF